MNIFRLCGDMSHVASIIVLLLRLRVAKNAQGISLRTHELFLLVFITRYLDLFTTYYSLYNSLMKMLYIATTGYIVHMMRNVEPICGTYDKAQDSFLHLKFLVAPCAVLAFFTNLIGGEVRSRDAPRGITLLLLCPILILTPSSPPQVST